MNSSTDVPTVGRYPMPQSLSERPRHAYRCEVCRRVLETNFYDPKEYMDAGGPCLDPTARRRDGRCGFTSGRWEGLR